MQTNPTLMTEAHAPIDESSAQQFRDAMAQLGAAVHIVTTDGPAGKAGFVASAVCSVTDAPPSILVCINRSSSAYAATKANGILCINTLSAEHQQLSQAFAAQRSMENRFALGHWVERVDFPPSLLDAVMSIDCRIQKHVPVGTHDILICQVECIAVNSHPGVLIYYHRRYHGLKRNPD